MSRRSKEADVARARAHARNRAPISANPLTNPATSQHAKEATASRLADALAKAKTHDDRPNLIFVDETYTFAVLAPETSDDEDDFMQKLDEMLNPAYGSPEWIKETEELFSDPTTEVFHPTQSKSRLQKIRPIKPGRHAKETAPGRMQKAWLALGSLASSLTVKHSPFSTTVNHRHPERTHPERRRSNKNLRAIGAMVATAAVITGALFATTSENGEPYTSRPQAVAQAYESPVPQQEVQAESTVESIPTPASQVMEETQTPEPAETVAAPTSFTITIESGSNIWDATKAELQKINPEIANQEVARMVNRIIVENGLNTPDLVYSGNTFTVSN